MRETITRGEILESVEAWERHKAQALLEAEEATDECVRKICWRVSCAYSVCIRNARKLLESDSPLAPGRLHATALPLDSEDYGVLEVPPNPVRAQQLKEILIALKGG